MGAGSIESRGQLEAVLGWIQAKDDAEITVQELYREGPARLGMSELELRQSVNEGIRQRRLAIGGLTSVIRVRRDEVDLN